MPSFAVFVWWSSFFVLITTASAVASEPVDAESAVRRLVRANAEKDLPMLSRMMAHDADIISYGVAGRKYVGWPELEQGMKEEFLNAQKLEIPIKELKVWTKGDLAWYAMELDYIRYVADDAGLKQTVLPMRETGVLERRAGRWQLLSWHESFRSAQLSGPLAPSSAGPLPTMEHSQGSPGIDLSGEWEIIEVEDDKRYKATFDQNGNGPYTQHGGRFTTSTIRNRLWQGSWHQPGNDREGGFEVLLSEDGTQAKGIWWYSRVGTQKNIPPREHGGTYHWKKIVPLSDLKRAPAR